MSSVANIAQLVDRLFFDANAAYRDSGVGLRVNLVRLQEVAYNEPTDTSTNLNRLTQPRGRIPGRGPRRTRCLWRRFSCICLST